MSATQQVLFDRPDLAAAVERDVRAAIAAQNAGAPDLSAQADPGADVTPDEIAYGEEEA